MLFMIYILLLQLIFLSVIQSFILYCLFFLNFLLKQFVVWNVKSCLLLKSSFSVLYLTLSKWLFLSVNQSSLKRQSLLNSYSKGLKHAAVYGVNQFSILSPQQFKGDVKMMCWFYSMFLTLYHLQSGSDVRGTFKCVFLYNYPWLLITFLFFFPSRCLSPSSSRESAQVQVFPTQPLQSFSLSSEVRLEGSWSCWSYSQSEIGWCVQTGSDFSIVGGYGEWLGVFIVCVCVWRAVRRMLGVQRGRRHRGGASERRRKVWGAQRSAGDRLRV